MADLADFDLTIPLVRTFSDGTQHTRDIRLRIPAEDQETAADVADQIGYEIVRALPDVGLNNRHGWKVAGYGATAEPAADRETGERRWLTMTATNTSPRP